MESGYRLLKNMSVVNLIATAAGLLEKNQCDELFATLPSFVARFGGPQPGDRIYKTIDLWTKPGHVFLVHESHDQLEADYRQIRAWEQAGRLFKLREVA